MRRNSNGRNVQLGPGKQTAKTVVLFGEQKENQPNYQRLLSLTVLPLNYFMGCIDAVSCKCRDWFQISSRRFEKLSLDFLNFNLEFITGVYSKVLQAQIYLITNSFGGRQA